MPDVVEVGTEAMDATGVGVPLPSVSISGSAFESANNPAIIFIPFTSNLLPPTAQYRTPPSVTAEINNSSISAETPQSFILSSSTLRRGLGGRVSVFGVEGVASEGGSMTEYGFSATGVSNDVEIGLCGGIFGNSGFFGASGFFGSSGFGTSSMRSTSSVTAGCRFAVGLIVLARSLPKLLLLPRRKDIFLGCFGRGEIGSSRNSGGISRRLGLGRAMARERMAAASRDIGICDIFSECKLGF